MAENPQIDMEHQPERFPRRRSWLRVLAWAGFTVGMLILIVVVLAVSAVHSPRVHRYLLTLANTKASQSLGVPVRIQNFVLRFPKAPSLSRIDIDVYGITVRGAEPFPSPPLALIQHVKVGIELSILDGKWSLKDIRVASPVVHLVFGPNGESNLPHLAKSSNNGSSLSFFDLGIHHLVVSQGEIYYQDRKMPLNADLRDLLLRVESGSGHNFTGTMSYRDGHLEAGTLGALPHQLDARFAFNSNDFHLEQATLKSGSSELQLTANLKDYSRPEVEAHYDMLLDAAQMRKTLQNAAIPSGRIAASGDIHYHSRPGSPLLNQLNVQGNLRSNQLDVTQGNMLVRIRSIAADYSVQQGNLNVRNFRASLLGGTVTASVSIRDLAGAARGSLEADASRLSLAQIQQVSASSTKAQLALSGIVNATIKADWAKQIQQTLVAQARASIHAGINPGASPHQRSTLPNQAGAGASRTPITGLLQATYSAKNKRLEFAPSYLQLPATRLTMNGALGQHSRLLIDVASSDLSRLEPLVDAIRTPGPGAKPLGLGGRMAMHATMTGSIESPQLAGSLTGHNLEVKGTEWRKLNADFEADPSSAAITQARLEPMGRGEIDVNARVGLRKWKFTESSPIHARLNASQLSLGKLAKVAGREQDLSGTLAANAQFDGSERNPVGHGEVTLTDAEIYQEPIHSARVTFTAAGNEIHTDLDASLPAGSITAKADLNPRAKTYTASVNTAGLDLGKLEALASRNLGVTGNLTLTGSGTGSFQNPEFTASLKIPRLGIKGQSIDDVDLETNVANHVANATLKALEQNTPIQARATVHMTGDYLMQASIDTQPLSLKPFLAMAAPAQADELHGETEIHATAEGPLKQKALLQASITIPKLSVGYGTQVDVAAQAPIHVEYRDQVLTLQKTSLQGTDIDLALAGSIPTAGQAPPSLTIQGSVNLKIAQLFNPDIHSSGELRLDINGLGANGTGGAEGKIELVNANVINGDWPVGVERGNGLLILTKDRLNIDHLTASVGGGKLTASGGVAYRPHLQFDLGIKVQGVRMLYPQGVRSEANADLRFTGRTDHAVLGGRAEIVDLAFTPGFDFMGLAGQFGGISAPPPQGFTQNLHLNIHVATANNFDLVSRTMSIGGAANLEVRGTAADPVILGRVSVSNGDVIFNGTRYVISGGTVEFANPNETKPVVNLGIMTTIQQYNINMRFRGPVDHMRTNFSSDPALPEADIISLLAFGKTTEANTANPATPGRQAAMGAVASQVSSQVTSRVSRIAGISHLSINPVLNGGTNQGPAGAVVTIQQRVTGNLFVTFSTNVTSTQYQTIMGQYRVSPRFAVSATRDQNGGFGFDVTMKKTW